MAMKITDVNVDDVVDVCSYEPDVCQCGCGGTCAGTWSYNPKHQKLGGDSRGYPVKSEELNLSEVERILTIFKDYQGVVWNLGSGLFTLDDMDGCHYRLTTVEDAMWWINAREEAAAKKNM